MAVDFFGKAIGFLGRGQPAAPAAAPPKKATTAFHAVTIEPGKPCCTAARTLSAQRFLSRAAPPLPLKACNRDDCTCRYVHFTDRRAKYRRARDVGVSVDGWVETERRDKPGRGRRQTDR
jgi:hypothetical protein